MITKLTKHDKCPVEVCVNPPESTHYASLRCSKHRKHIQWLNQQQAQAILEIDKGKCQ